MLEPLQVSRSVLSFPYWIMKGKLDDRSAISSTKQHSKRAYDAYIYLCFLKLRNRCLRFSNKSDALSVSATLSSSLFLSSWVSPGGSLEAFIVKPGLVLQIKKTIYQRNVESRVSWIDYRLFTSKWRHAYLSKSIRGLLVLTFLYCITFFCTNHQTT